MFTFDMSNVGRDNPQGSFDCIQQYITRWSQTFCINPPLLQIIRVQEHFVFNLFTTWVRQQASFIKYLTELLMMSPLCCANIKLLFYPANLSYKVTQWWFAYEMLKDIYIYIFEHFSAVNWVMQVVTVLYGSRFVEQFSWPQLEVCVKEERNKEPECINNNNLVFPV